MSAGYKPVSWNRSKLVYDAAVLLGIAAYLLIYLRVGPSLARELVVAFLNATFDGGERYVARLLKVAAMEQNMKVGGAA